MEDPKQNIALQLIQKLRSQDAHLSNRELWQLLTQQYFSKNYPFEVYLHLFNMLFPDWKTHPEYAPAFIPDPHLCEQANISQFMSQLKLADLASLHHFSVQQYQQFWQYQIHKLNIQFKITPKQICDLSKGIESPQWLQGAALNIADSCFSAAASATAIIYQDQSKKLRTYSYGELNHLSNRIANSLIDQGYHAGDPIGIALPMTLEAIAIYLGIIKMGGIVVSIADSFSSEEIALRLKMTHTKVLFTQDFSLWDKKKLPLYQKIISSSHYELPIIVLAAEAEVHIPLRNNDLYWHNFLVAQTDFSSIPCDPMQTCNILFSSGTTAKPKAIPWNHTTAIKAASDAYFHHNIQKNDVCTWPTSLGWMMGPWLIFASLINQATIAVYPETPKNRAFGEFIQDAKVSILGVVPTLVASWHQSKCMEQLNWQALKIFTSTGECSNPEDMLYLMWLGAFKPIIEYCGGTEIGGAYLSSTVIQDNYLSLFSSKAIGLDIDIIDEQSKHSENGEVVIIPPSIGLSTTLFNADHHQIYFANMPKNKGQGHKAAW